MSFLSPIPAGRRALCASLLGLLLTVQAVAALAGAAPAGGRRPALYSTPGHHSGSLTVTAGGASVTRRDTGYVLTYGRRPAPAFSTAQVFSMSSWVVCPGRAVQLMGETQYCPASFSSTLPNPLVTYNPPGTYPISQDVLESPPLDLTGLTRATLRFDAACQPYSTAGYDDTLAVEVYGSCPPSGLLSQVYRKNACVDLGTGPFATGGDYVPQAASDWRTEGAYLAAFVGEKIRLRFVPKNQFGNSICLDNVTLNDQPLGLNGTLAPAAPGLWPNPVAPGAPLHLTLPDGPAPVRLLDVPGRVADPRTVTADDATALNLAPPRVAGLYTVRVLATDGAAYSRRVVGR